MREGDRGRREESTLHPPPWLVSRCFSASAHHPLILTEEGIAGAWRWPSSLFTPAWYPFTRSQTVRPHLWGARTSGGGLWGRESSYRRHGLLSKGEVGTLRPVRLEVSSLRTAASEQGEHAGLCLGSQGTREGWVPDRSMTGVLKYQSDISWFRSYWVGQTFPTLSLYFLLAIGWS